MQNFFRFVFILQLLVVVAYNAVDVGVRCGVLGTMFHHYICRGRIKALFTPIPFEEKALVTV